MNKIVMCVLFSLATVMASGQSYSTMESRFNRSELTEADSTAFINQGRQKARSLFDLGKLFISNSGRSSNQSYIQRGTNNIFYVEEGDSVDTGDILQRTSQAESTDGEPIRFKLEDADGYLAKISTVNSDPPFIFYLVLAQIVKKFGEEEERVWDVMLKEVTE
ncbi:hypothetical protein [Phaeocystidibacter luteus]|uniref:Uncharacterized protein n=1 Tax=Phaeocystidibacter luteus TaxID=911197 RepID=A0A6N6RKF9_9FLAO|nr:hypothetical protein [Phaeocystidibacter luteus]KAB2810075.1 hypothetical protein F8C67_07510 [Phaeocystidibacter luteus]